MTPTVAIQAASVTTGRDPVDRARPSGARRTWRRADGELQRAQVGLDHAIHQLGEAHLGLPAEPLARPAGVAHARAPLDGADERGVDAQVALAVEVHAGEGRARERLGWEPEVG